MQKQIVVAAGILLLAAGGAVGIYQFRRPHEGIKNVEPGVTIRAAALYAAYQANEPAADTRFLGKVIRVSGRVASINRTGFAGYLVIGDAGSGGINCSFDPESSHQLRNINNGDSVSCKGRCTGFLMDVNLADCVLEP